MAQLKNTKVWGDIDVTGIITSTDIVGDCTSLRARLTTKDDVGLGNVDNVQQIPLTQKGAANGVAELDSNSKVPVVQVPDHNSLNGLQAAASGVTHGHITAAAQTIAGVKTFSSIPVGPASNPTTDNQLARKAYVDSKAASAKTLAVTTYSASTPLDDTNDVVLVNAATAGVSIVLPSATGRTGKVYNIKKIDSSTNTVTVTPNGTQKIDGADNIVISAQYDSCTIVSNGTHWYII